MYSLLEFLNSSLYSKLNIYIYCQCLCHYIANQVCFIYGCNGFWVKRPAQKSNAACCFAMKILEIKPLRQHAWNVH